jgi:hypothetical protein
MGFAFVQPDLGAALHVGIEQPADSDARPLDPSDFAQGHRQLMLPGVGCGRPSHLAWGQDARDHGGALRKMSGQFAARSGSLIVPPISPFRSLGQAAGSKRERRFDGRALIRGMNWKPGRAVTAKTWSVKRPMSAYCLWTFWPASVIRSPSRV